MENLRATQIVTPIANYSLVTDGVPLVTPILVGISIYRAN